MSDKKQYDMNSPEAKALIDEIVHGTFVKEGTMIAFPMCFPGITVPIVADESRITALTLAADGRVYGGTSGYRSHLFIGMFHGVTGMVFDLGVVEGANRCAAVCCGRNSFAACVNGPAGGRVVTHPLCGMPFDLIQEWGFSRQPVKDLGEPVKGEPILHAVSDASGSAAIGMTPSRVFAVDIDEGKIEVLGEVAGAGRIALGPAGKVYGLDGSCHLWCCDPKSRRMNCRAVSLPRGTWTPEHLRWAGDRGSGLLYLADADGNLFTLSEAKGIVGPVGRAPLAPVGPMAVTHDGRLFGSCGLELAKLFCFEPVGNRTLNLGVAVSVLERRRYGYCFGDAVTGRDGQIYFGEDDDLGHLWIYFPCIRGRATT
ncbi:MAG: hypothetical protein KA354_21980 [Phycisphaerae bacterium]|nr:hypothetical protein [Phycisphaerae bacterium]